jgi:dTDP-glucose 4,6-dehydratase
MIVYIDIDETIATTPEDRNYSLSEPIVENIKKANKYYDDGHVVIYWTARGSGSGIDWFNITKDQLDTWGVKYHELKLGKPVYDLFIDDKSMNPSVWDTKE